MIILRKAQSGDCHLLFQWINDRITRENSFQVEEISYEEHVKWFERKMKDSACQMFILVLDGKEAGQIRLDWEKEQGIISYSIAPDYRGMGLGNKILELVEEFAAGKELVGVVKKQNLASGKCFEKNGYDRKELEDCVEYRKKVGM